MAQNTSYGTADRIIRQALTNCGLLQEGDDPSSETIADCMNRLNDLINFMQTQGLKLWTLIDQSVTLINGQSTYTLKPGGSVNMTKPLRIDYAYYLDSNSNSRPLIGPLSWEEYLSLSNKSTTGSINSYFVNKKQTEVDVILWPIPDSTAATGTLHLLIRQQITNFTGITDTLNFPPEWYLYLTWALADEKSTGQPQTIMDRCEKRAFMAMEALRGWDVEDGSVFLSPDMRTGYGNSRFS